MNSRTLTRGLALCITLALAACATTPPQEHSILDAMAEQSLSKPLSCAAMNAATVCMKSSRLDRNKNCACADRHSIANGGMLDTF